MQGLIDRETDDDNTDDDNDEPAIGQQTRNGRIKLKALNLRKALIEIVRFLVKPGVSQNSMPGDLMMNLRMACSGQFRSSNQQCIAEFYDNIMQVLSEGLSGEHLNIDVQFHFCVVLLDSTHPQALASIKVSVVFVANYVVDRAVHNAEHNIRIWMKKHISR